MINWLKENRPYICHVGVGAGLGMFLAYFLAGIWAGLCLITAVFAWEAIWRVLKNTPIDLWDIACGLFGGGLGILLMRSI